MFMIKISAGATEAGGNILEIVQVIGQLSIGAIVASASVAAVVRFFHDRTAHRRQVEMDAKRYSEELNFKRLKEAQVFLDAVKTNPMIRAAFSMMDYDVSDHMINETIQTIHQSELIDRHLNPDHMEHDEKDIYVRQCFDEMLTTLSEVSNMIESGLAAAWIFEPSMLYYSKFLSESAPEWGKDVSAVVIQYAKHFDMGKSLTLHSQLVHAYDTPIHFSNING